MSRYLLDTNILSNPLKPASSAPLKLWLEEQADEDLCICSMSLAELWSGILDLPVGRRRHALEEWFASPLGPLAFFQDRILPFEEKAALVWGRIMSDGVKAGKPRSPIDMILAAVAEANGCILVTANEKHFAGLRFINPTRSDG